MRVYKDLVPLAHEFEQDLFSRMSEGDREAVLAGFAALERVALAR